MDVDAEDRKRKGDSREVDLTEEGDGREDELVDANGGNPLKT